MIISNMSFITTNKNESFLNNNIFTSIHKPISLLNESLFNINKSYSTLNQTEFNLEFNQTDLELVTVEKNVVIVVPILFSLIFIIGLFGNALVVIVVVFNATMRNTTNLLILNLAIADVLFIIFCVPFTASDYALANWPFGNIWCKIVQYLIFTLACASNYTLVLMSLDRYLAVVHPVKSISIRTPRNAYFAICLTWIAILIFYAPALITHEALISLPDQEDNLKFTLCRFNFKNTLMYYSQFQIIFFLSSYVIPLMITFSLYFLMLKRLWRSTENSINSSHLNSIRNKKRVTRMVIIVVLIFAFCWAPIQIILVLKSLNFYITDNATKVIIQITAQVLAYMNSCINPILYAFLSENFRKAFHKVIACNLGSIYGMNSNKINHNTNEIGSLHNNINETIRNNSIQTEDQIYTLNKKNLINKILNISLQNKFPSTNSFQITNNQISTNINKINLNKKKNFNLSTQNLNTNSNRAIKFLVFTDGGLYLSKHEKNNLNQVKLIKLDFENNEAKNEFINNSNNTTNLSDQYLDLSIRAVNFYNLT